MEQRVLTKELIELFIQYLIQEEKSQATLEKYQRDLTAFMRFIGGSEISKEVTIAYKQKLIQSGYAERSINSMLAAINSFFAYLGWYECRVKSLKLSPEIYRPEEKELTKEEFDRLVTTAYRTGKEKIALIIQTICGTGIRVSELEFITVEAVHSGEAIVHCKGKIRKVFIVKNYADCSCPTPRRI